VRADIHYVIDGYAMVRMQWYVVWQRARRTCMGMRRYNLRVWSLVCDVW